MSCDLSAELRSDRTASARYHNGLSADISGDGIYIYGNGISSQKVFNFHITKSRYVYLTA